MMILLVLALTAVALVALYTQARPQPIRARRNLTDAEVADLRRRSRLG